MKRSERLADYLKNDRPKYWATVTFKEAECDFETFRKEKIAYWTNLEAPKAKARAPKIESMEDLVKAKAKSDALLAQIKAFEESQKK